jgi:hypothetical protein
MMHVVGAGPPNLASRASRWIEVKSWAAKMIIVTDEYSWAELKSGLQSTRFEHKLAWRETEGRKLIIAVGGPSQWAAPGPLPADAVVTNVVAAARSEPELAELFWGRFCHTFSIPRSPLGGVVSHCSLSWL